MGEGGREAAVSRHMEVLTKGFLHHNDGLVKAAKLDKGLPTNLLWHFVGALIVPLAAQTNPTCRTEPRKNWMSEDAINELLVH
jgi:hypothetical protein